MASGFIGDGATNGGSDLNSGSRLNTTFIALDHAWDQGEFGFPFPANARIYPAMQLLGGAGGLGDGLPANRAGITPLTTTPVSIFGSSFNMEGFLVAAEVTPNPVIETMMGLMGTTALTIFLQETVVFAIRVLGDFPVFTIPPLSREHFAETAVDGVRPSSPWCIERTVSHNAEVVIEGVFQIALDTPFLVDAQFLPVNDPILSDLGARANYLGVVVQVARPDASLATLARFRAPELHEVIVVKPCDVFRWDGERWAPYLTQPQRNLDGQMAFQLLDPDRVYDYYAKVLGVFAAQWQYDTARLRDFTEPRKVPDVLVPLLGDNFGLVGDTEYSVPRQRVLIRQFVELMRKKGTAQGIVDALTILGYTGYGQHVWVIPGGGPTDYIERPFGYDLTLPAGPYHPASQVAIHVNDLDGNPIIIDEEVRQSVGDFLMRFVLPAHIRVRYFVTDTPVGATPEGIDIADSLTITDV